MQVKVKQSELKIQQEYLKNLREAVKDVPGFWPFTLVSPLSPSSLRVVAHVSFL